ncbi:TetR/AcrR family transcriptional regulator [Streptomyces sp. enrichment culture]|uniref:TetR/AcrR family transcriptional regulator n=1 Tax=Streptomyces sp. enrichment culture TaxID=1795815 RepID=UPI003F56CB30
MDNRSRILQAATELLEASANADVVTRSVADRAGVQQPVIYRIFGDKDSLLAAVVDHGLNQYLAAKRAMEATPDPVADLVRGWDQHTQFALEHPNVYRLMAAPGLASAPQALGEMHKLLRAILERVAQAGRLAVTPERAADIIMSANTGVALALLSRSETQPSTELSDQVRDIVLAGVLTPDPGDAPSHGTATTVQVATTLAALLRATPPQSFTPAERELLAEWLMKLTHDAAFR